MAQRTVSGPGEDYLDDAITRFAAQKTSTGLVLARAFRAIHHRFLALGSAIAGAAAGLSATEQRVGELAAELEAIAQRHQQRLNDHRVELATANDRLTALEQANADLTLRVTKIESQDRGDLASMQALAARIAKLEARADDHEADELLRAGLQRLANRGADARLLRAAADILEGPRIPNLPAQEPTR